MSRPLTALVLILTLCACSSPTRSDSTPGDAGEVDRCSDGLAGDTEEGVDCGGDCPPCQEPDPCEGDEDCDTGTCLAGRCVEGSLCGRQDGTLAFECPCQSPEQCSSQRCTDARCDAKPLTSSSWADTLGLGAYIGERFAFDCPPNALQGSIWGTGIYTLDSSICTAGIHAGRITLEDGGRVVIEIKPGQDSYEGSTRHGVTSYPWPSYHSSFEVVGDARCSDGEKSHDEADVDCGGSCTPCGLGRTCVVDDDCTTGFCGDGVCARPLCANERLDDGEIDVDCGGACPKCENAKTCGAHADCTSGNCEDGVCARPLCSNERLDDGETDVDCGGPGCSKCEVGKRCGGSADCRGSSECREGVCAVPLCEDGRQGQDETDVDCGGPACVKCRGGQTCVEDADCKGGRCDDGVCAVPTCANGIKDGLETDVDCGGVVCSPCPLNKACSISMDCESRTCTQRVCAAAGACVNGIRDGDESDVDCGGDCAPCAGGLTCYDHDDCEGSCEDDQCAIPTADASTRLGFSNVEPGRRWTYQCPPGLTERSVWGVDVFTGDSSICTAAVHAGLHSFATGGVVTVASLRGQVSYAGSTENGVTTRSYGAYSSAYAFVPPGPCANRVRDGKESDVDCGGDRCARCGAGARCQVDDDCAGALCVGGYCAD